jgi:hypothetical protein
MSLDHSERRAPNRRTAAVVAVASAVAMAVPLPASAAGGRVVERSGDCAGRGTWTMKVSNQDRGLEVEFELDVNRVGQRWRLRISHNGRQAANVVRTTRAPSGGFTVRAVTRNDAGIDRFRARAVRLDGNNSCVGRVGF